MMSLSDREWKSFLISNIFTYEKGNQNNMALLPEGKVPLISARKYDNGLKAFVADNDKVIFNGNCVSYNNDGNGGAGLSYYQPCDFYLDSHCTALTPKETREKLAILAMVACLNMQQDKYNHGYALNSNRIKKFRFLLPVKLDGQPDYDFMEAYVNELKQIKLGSYKAYCIEQLTELGSVVNIDKIEDKEWKEFFIDELFNIASGKRLESYNMADGERPFIGATDSGNGVTHYISNENESLDSNVLGVNYDGNGMVISFYHPYECLFSDSVKRFHLKHYSDNKFVLLFIKMLILQQKEKYNYGYKFNEVRMKRQKIMIPVTEKGDPDYDYMEQYSKNIMIKKYREYLKYIKKTN